MADDNRASRNVTPAGQGETPPNMRPIGQPDRHPIDDAQEGPSPEVRDAVTPEVQER